MKKNLLVASVFLLGLGLGGASANASNLITPGSEGTQITEEMARCVSACELAGGSHTTCWNCCVKNICPIEID
ncbi:hypothetical protein [Archangium lansingense]|uniref:Uncharacterized protein n=1 Tax=Archangium lansingense TaxID=2995310 RepID=A0ABT4A892_9BACT|nr:hypothetical protein [Archangium lansinium]MCY1077479.1 hypothetical protein [Archangium lansinium]